MNLIGLRAKKAFLERVNIKTKDKVLNEYASLLDKEKKSILIANAKDTLFASKKKLNNNLVERLSIDEKKLSYIKNSIKKIAKLKDPVDNSLEKWSRPNGLNINRISIQIGRAHV